MKDYLIAYKHRVTGEVYGEHVQTHSLWSAVDQATRQIDACFELVSVQQVAS